MAKGNPTRHRAREMSQPVNTVGMEDTISWGSRNRRSTVTEFHAWMKGCSSIQLTIFWASDAWVTSMEGD